MHDIHELFAGNFGEWIVKSVFLSQIISLFLNGEIQALFEQFFMAYSVLMSLWCLFEDESNF